MKRTTVISPGQILSIIERDCREILEHTIIVLLIKRLKGKKFHALFVYTTRLWAYFLVLVTRTICVTLPNPSFFPFDFLLLLTFHKLASSNDVDNRNDGIVLILLFLVFMLCFEFDMLICNKELFVRCFQLHRDIWRTTQLKKLQGKRGRMLRQCKHYNILSSLLSSIET
ncbi:hypothetical protein AB4K20DRAFT_1983662 [Rhizopus microsporus]|uniref:Uncharacterized protein n=1 Tax=Rhizopus microsporus TaxID=58291 RepID=A0A1X0S0M8_RHIZD|nr:hypothetical protein BCV71DRAFT_235558 [Rhizopus microsporus]